MSTFRSEQLRQPLSLSGSFTGSLQGTASFATTASFALFAANGGGSSSPTNLISTGSVTASVNIGNDTFRLTSGSSTFIYVNNSGSIGLGNVPTYSLDVNLGNNKSVRLQSGNSNNSFLGAAFGNTAISNNIYYNGSNWVYEKNATAVLLQLGFDQSFVINSYPAQPAGTVGLPSLAGTITMLPGGNVGIGTPTPGYKLEVDGSGRFTSGLTITGSVGISGSFNDGIPKLILTGVTDDPADTLTYNTVVNTLGDTFTFTATNGVYQLTMNTATPFRSGYTYIMFTAGLPGPGAGNVYNTPYEYINESTIKFYVKKFDEPYGGRLTHATIEIRVYPIP